MSADARAIAELYGRAWDAGSPEELLDQVLAEDVVDHSPSTGQGEGREGIRQAIRRYHSAFPDLKFVHDDVLVDGDRVVVRWHATGTHEGDGLGVPATHRQVNLTGIDIVRIADSRIVERWGEADGHKLRQQLAPS